MFVFQSEFNPFADWIHIRSSFQLVGSTDCLSSSTVDPFSQWIDFMSELDDGEQKEQTETLL